MRTRNSRPQTIIASLFAPPISYTDIQSHYSAPRAARCNKQQLRNHNQRDFLHYLDCIHTATDKRDIVCAMPLLRSSFIGNKNGHTHAIVSHHHHQEQHYSDNVDPGDQLILAKYSPSSPGDKLTSQHPSDHNNNRTKSGARRTLTSHSIKKSPDRANCRSSESTNSSTTSAMIKWLVALIFVLFGAVHVSTNWLNVGICKFQECCHPNDGTGYITYEKGCDQLLETLKTRVYGQPLIVGPIYKALKAHMGNERPSRPLVMYFSGWTGTGKTHVARLIAQNLYKNGMSSKFVKYISSSYHFPIKIEGDKEIIVHRQRLRDMIKDTVQGCERSLIILDELDKLPPGVVDTLQPMLDYIEDVDGVKYNKAIFIFLSNTGAEKLNTLSYKMFKEGKERKDLSSKDIEEILIKESYNEQGGLRGSSLLRRYSIGVFVPFLPLERQHVKLCIKTEIENSHVIPDNLDELVEEIADEMTYFPEETQMYSKSGCKGVHDKVINYIGPPINFNISNDLEHSDHDGEKLFAKSRSDL